MVVVLHLASAFAEAHKQQRDTFQRWMTVSLLGGALPNSLLPWSIQEIGHMDVLLRSAESEGAEIAERTGEWPLYGNYSSTLAHMWIGSAYELVRLLTERHLVELSDAVAKLKWDLSLLRIPIEKHEIAGRKKTGVLDLEPISDLAGNSMPRGTYDPDDPKRAFIMQQGLSDRGSSMWYTYDYKAGTMRWIERRQLSDRMLDLWAPVALSPGAGAK